jgi:hypothetical protein
LDAPAGIAKIAFAGQLGWLTSTLDGSLIYLAAFILSRKYAALMMKSLPELMKGQCRSGSERTHFGTHEGHRCQEGVRIWPGDYVLLSPGGWLDYSSGPSS